MYGRSWPSCPSFKGHKVTTRHLSVSSWSRIRRFPLRASPNETVSGGDPTGVGSTPTSAEMSSPWFPATVTRYVCPFTTPSYRRWLPVCRTNRNPLSSNMRMTSRTFTGDCVCFPDLHRHRLFSVSGSAGTPVRWNRGYDLHFSIHAWTATSASVFNLFASCTSFPLHDDTGSYRNRDQRRYPGARESTNQPFRRAERRVVPRQSNVRVV